jgi:tetraacyldisaccharide 4'-kinase
VLTSNYAKHNPQTNQQQEQPQSLKQLTVDFVVPRVLADFAHQADGTIQTLSSFRGQKMQALAGIGKPEAFFDMLTAQGIGLSVTQALADHEDMHSVRIDPAMGAVLCTEKDAVKLWNYLPTAWAVPLVTEIPEELFNSILAHIGPKLSSGYGHQTT